MTDIPLSPAGEAVWRRMRMVGRNRAPSILFDALLAGELPEGDMPWLTADAWTMCEYPTRVEESLMWLALFDRIGYRNAAGDRLDRPEQIILYRGASVREREIGEYGMSWTTDRERARWFATEYFARAGDNQVYKCVMPGDALVADYQDDDRNESEIVVNPSKINPEHVTVEEIMPTAMKVGERG